MQKSTNPVVSIILDRRRVKHGGKYPVKLVVYNYPLSRAFGLKIDLTVQEFDLINSINVPAELEKIKSLVQNQVQKAKTILDDLHPFSFEGFKKQFICDSLEEENITPVQAPAGIEVLTPEIHNLEIHPAQPDDVFQLYISYINTLLDEERDGTASSYADSMNSLKKFSPALPLTDITPSFLNRYEKWMLNRKCSKTTIGMYLRALRFIYNEAIDKKLVSKELYPFGKRKYKIPTGRNVKKALPLTDIGKIYHYQPVDEKEAKAKAFWLLSYLGNGMNIKDIALLKFSNIDGEFISFERAKTIRTSKDNPQPIHIYITNDIRDIIERWGNRDRAADNYIFPILTHNLTSARQRQLIKQFIRWLNNWMKKIAEKLGIKKKTTTLAARHSFSTILKNSGASTEYISEALGHTTLTTTQNYLDSFESDTSKGFAAKLTAF